MKNRPQYIIWHHSGGPEGKPAPTWADVTRWHEARGWRTVGYHFGVTPDGAIERGRDVSEAGAHVQGLNDRSVGVCLLGNFDHGQVPTEQFLAAVEITRVLQLIYGISHERVLGHRETGPLVPVEQRTKKQCPGRHIDMGAVRSRLLQSIGEVTV